jgi:hypothetical protein
MDEGMTKETKFGDSFWEGMLRAETMSDDELASYITQLEAITDKAERGIVAALEEQVVRGTLTAEQAAAKYADFRRRLRAVDDEAATLAAKAARHMVKEPERESTNQTASSIIA